MMLVLVAAALLALGVILMVAGIILLALSRGGGGARGAGVVIIGPIPVLVASDKETARLALLLTVAALAVFALFVAVSLGVRP